MNCNIDINKITVIVFMNNFLKILHFLFFLCRGKIVS